jgi:NAD(P)-dependent dehydrogenase (short-subunit alcohol dehydrogenase family)
MNFSGKVASLIPGAGSPQGIGFATARLLAQQGSKIAITSTTERIEERARELAAEGADVFAFPADLRDQERTHVLVQDVIARYGRLDILVNNAGMTQVGSPTETSSLPLAELSEKEWDYGIAINLKTAFNITKAILPFMLKAKLLTVRPKPEWSGLLAVWHSRLPARGSLRTRWLLAGLKPHPQPGKKPSLVEILRSAGLAGPTKLPLLSRFSPLNPLPTSPAN